ncbi:MAG TPA: aminotransferase class I/II-fold pyridoxal phosphate-dependent enzyme [Streptosporangiaceae bacterium]|nr:aminotransferase class I/II-fold pyridoxal phosphate-dependent enzyme [Streptosporangiaceae bacterium]
MSLHPETRAIHPVVPDLGPSRPVSVPIYQTSTFAFADAAACAAALNDPSAGYAYSRYRNPTTNALENALADLEGGSGAIATSSGMGAVNAVLLSQLRAGDHVIAQQCLYGGTFAVFADLAARYGIDVSYISGRDPAEVGAALRPRSRLLYLETIANPTAAVSDLPGLLAAARAAGLTSVVDNTFATPMLCRPIELGADIVLHSATKYLGGHDDVTLGIIVAAGAEQFGALWQHTTELGVAADPFAAWLTLRGLKTLALRMDRHCATAGFLARQLAAHPAVAAVHWPGLAGHPDHAVAARILSGFGGMLAFDLAGGRAAGLAFVEALRLAALAPSLGGAETLVLHPASTSHRQLDSAQLAAAGVGPGSIRVSAGLEHPDDLWADFAQALAAT